MCEYVSQDGQAPSSIIFPSSSRSGMVSTRSPGWRSSLYSNVPVNRDATGGGGWIEFLQHPQLNPLFSGLWRGQEPSSATRWRCRTAFLRRAPPRSPLGFRGRSVGWGHPTASAGSLQPAPRGPGFLPPLPCGLPRRGWTPLVGLLRSSH